MSILPVGTRVFITYNPDCSFSWVQSMNDYLGQEAHIIHAPLSSDGPYKIDIDHPHYNWDRNCFVLNRSEVYSLDHFKTGTKVFIDLTPDNCEDRLRGPGYNSDMSRYFGKIATIVSCTPSKYYRLDVDGGYFSWTFRSLKLAGGSNSNLLSLLTEDI